MWIFINRKVAVRCMTILRSCARLSQDDCEDLQDCPKRSHVLVMQTSSVVVHFAAFLRHKCNKAQDHCTVLSSSLTAFASLICECGLLGLSYKHLACLAAVLCPHKKNRKENEHVENLVLVSCDPVICRVA